MPHVKWQVKTLLRGYKSMATLKSNAPEDNLDTHRTVFFSHLDLRYLNGGDNVSFEQVHLAQLLNCRFLKPNTSRGSCIKISSQEMLLNCLMTASVCFLLPSLRCYLEFFQAAFWIWKI